MPGEPAAGRTVAFVIEARDLRQAVRLHAFAGYRRPAVIFRLALLWLVAVAVLLAVGYADRDDWPARLLYVLPPALAALGAIVGTILAVPLLAAPLAIRKRMREEKLLHETAVVTWDDDAYAVAAPSAQSRLAWTDYLDLREDRHLFVLATSSFNYQILPKRVLDPEQVADLHDILVRHRAR